MMKRISLILFMASAFQIIYAEVNAIDIVKNFGLTMSTWCKIDDISCREKLEKMCSGLKSCRVEDKILSDYLFLKGQSEFETFCLDSYLNMFETIIDDGVTYELKNLKLETEDHFPNGQSLYFVTADVNMSGKTNYNIRNLFLVREDKISGIYSFKSKYGFNHLHGSLISALKEGDFSHIYPFYDGYAIVVKNGKAGLIDLKGNLVIPCIWDHVDYGGGGVFAYCYNYKSNNTDAGYYDLRFNARQIPCLMLTWVIGREKVPTEFSEGFAVVKKNGKYGYLKEDDTEYKIDYKYDDATRFSDGYATVSINGKKHIINTKFKTVLKEPDLYKFIDHPYEGLIKVKNVNNKFGFMDLKGDIVIPCVYDNVEPFVNGLAQVQLGNYPNEKIGFVNKAGEVVIPIDLVGSWSVGFEDGYCEVFKNVTFDYYHKGKVEKKTELRSTLLGIDGQPLPGFGWDYHEVRRFCGGYARFMDKAKGKYGFLNEKGEIAILPTYSFAQFFVEGYSCVGIVDENGKHKYGCINTDGVLVIPYIYDDVFYFSGGVANVVKDGKAGLVDAYGNSTFINQ